MNNASSAHSYDLLQKIDTILSDDGFNVRNEGESLFVKMDMRKNQNTIIDSIKNSINSMTGDSDSSRMLVDIKVIRKQNEIQIRKRR